MSSVYLRIALTARTRTEFVRGFSCWQDVACVCELRIIILLQTMMLGHMIGLLCCDLLPQHVTLLAFCFVMIYKVVVRMRNRYLEQRGIVSILMYFNILFIIPEQVIVFLYYISYYCNIYLTFHVPYHIELCTILY